MPSSASTPATVRGALVGLVSFAASLTAHAVAMSAGTGMAGHDMASMPPAPATPHHATAGMAEHSMAGHSMAGHSMAGHSMAGHSMAGHSMAGHSMAGMDMAGMAGPVPAPTETAMSAAPAIPATSVLLLTAVCALLGLLAARPRSAGPVAAGALVLFGQGAGHLALGITMGHLAITPAMALAHVAAAAVAGVAIAGAEAALRLALATLRPIPAGGTVLRRTVVARDWTFRITPLSVLTCHGALRAPPA